ncbi:hypothetical protein SAMN04488051_10749 [Alkalimonas amylolytica]|uniref:Uncharacterized protein n=1 Tax=Alkalimonas amylolytica TaxID=152573 RepID=A0A1H4EIC9_ALKAM|nr:hypothetical protein SAMN04488051_10749 [Alkalimonas amylolytica]
MRLVAAIAMLICKLLMAGVRFISYSYSLTPMYLALCRFRLLTAKPVELRGFGGRQLPRHIQNPQGHLQVLGAVHAEIGEVAAVWLGK